MTADQCVWCGALAVVDEDDGRLLWTAALDDGVVSYSIACEHETVDGTRSRASDLDVLANLSENVRHHIAVVGTSDVIHIYLPASIAGLLSGGRVGGVPGACRALYEIHGVYVEIEVC